MIQNYVTGKQKIDVDATKDYIVIVFHFAQFSKGESEKPEAGPSLKCLPRALPN